MKLTDQRGRTRGVLLSVSEYRRLTNRLEFLEDSLALKRARRQSGRLVSHGALVVRLRRKGRL